MLWARIPSTFVALPVVVLSLLRACDAACFLPNGTDINQLRSPNSETWQACDLRGQSMCCRTNGGAQPYDKCRPNGLCHNDVGPNWWRESCTDPTWQAPACLQLCISKTAVNVGSPTFADGTPLSDSHVPLTQCPDGSFCCGINAFNCCSAGQGLFIQNGKVVTSTTARASPSTATSDATKATATTIVNGSSSSSNSSNVGAIVGGAVGGLVAGILIVVALLWCWRRKRQTQNSYEVSQHTHMPWLGQQQPYVRSELHDGSVHELGSGVRSRSQSLHAQAMNDSDKFAKASESQAQSPATLRESTSISGRYELPVHQNIAS